MAIQGSRELRAALSAIKKGEIRPVYLVFGAEAYMVREASGMILEAIAGKSGAEIVRIDASGKPPEAVLEPVAAPSLFAPARVVAIRRFAHLLAGETADRLLAGIDDAVGPGAALVFTAPGTDEKVDKRFKGTKGLMKRGTTLELNRQRREDLVKWLRDEAAKDGKELTPDGADGLLRRVGEDMQGLRNELDKAVLYCLDRERIGAADLDKLVGRSREEAAWDVAEAIAGRDLARAMEIVKDLLKSGTHPLVFLALLIRQTRHVLQARLLWEEAARPPFRDIGAFRSRVAPTFEAGAFGGGFDDVTTIHPFACFKRFEAAKRHEIGDLRERVGRLRRADRDVKTGAAGQPEQVLEELVLELCARGGAMAKGEAA